MMQHPWLMLDDEKLIFHYLNDIIEKSQIK